MATLSAPAGFSSSNLVFEENFSGTTLDSYWHNYITSNAANGWPWNDNGSGGSGPGGAYDADYDMPSQVTVSNGLLDLTAIQQTVSGMNQGTAQTFPITSGAVSSYGNFEFDGGYLQISMKAPSGDGAWPGLWLLPGQGAGSSGDNFEIDIQEGGYTGSGPANQAFSYHLHTPSGTFGGVIDTGIDLTADFHTYGINWVPGESITWYLDGKQMAQITSAQAPIPNEPMELIMSNQVANSNAAGWHTVLDSSTPQSMQMQIDAIQLYQLPGSGNTVTGSNVTATSSSSSTTTTTPTVQPAVTQVAASPTTGVEHPGDTVAFTLGFNEAVTVTGTPTLELNDGSVATYTGGSGTSALSFSTTIASTDTSTSSLAVTGVNLPSGSSIKDAAGVAADLSGAVKTFSGLAIDTTSPVATSPSQSTAPVLSVADNTLDVTAGSTVDLGLGVSTSDPNDAVTVTITGLPRYETITDALDGHTFHGKSITLTAAEVNSGLTLQSNYRGSDHPVATLKITATGTDPVTNVATKSASQTITVTDPPAQTSTASPGSAVADRHFALLNQYLASGFDGKADHGQITTVLRQEAGWHNEAFLSKPHS